MATIDSYDPSRSLKDSLRAADALRQRGNQALTENDLETAFVNMARAGTIIVEKIPKHPDYLKLRADQRQNLASVSYRSSIHVMTLCRSSLSRQNIAQISSLCSWWLM